MQNVPIAADPPRNRRAGRIYGRVASSIGFALAFVATQSVVHATDFSLLNATPPPDPALAPPPAAQGSFVASWLAMVSATQAAQPHWITPLVTVTPRLEQEVRYDYNITDQSNGSHIVNIGSGKGPEFIPTYDTEVSLGLPPVEQMTNAKGVVTHGYGDWPTMLLKYRFISANEQQGNYIVTGFIQASAPVGTNGFSNDVYVVQPTLAVGKGWGDFDIQSTLSQQYAIATVGPPGSLQNFGDPILSNTSFQYHLFEYFWPELEVNYTYWPSGIHKNLSQTMLTAGLIIGRIPLGGRFNIIFGAGYQFAVSEHPVTSNNWVVTSRVTF